MFKMPYPLWQAFITDCLQTVCALRSQQQLRRLLNIAARMWVPRYSEQPGKGLSIWRNQKMSPSLFCFTLDIYGGESCREGLREDWLQASEYSVESAVWLEILSIWSKTSNWSLLSNAPIIVRIKCQFCYHCPQRNASYTFRDRTIGWWNSRSSVVYVGFTTQSDEHFIRGYEKKRVKDPTASWDFHRSSTETPATVTYYGWNSRYPLFVSHRNYYNTTKHAGLRCPQSIYSCGKKIFFRWDKTSECHILSIGLWWECNWPKCRWKSLFRSQRNRKGNYFRPRTCRQ